MRAALLLLTLAACKGGGEEDSTPAVQPTVSIEAPADGSSYTTLDPVPLSVVASADGQAVDITRATWTIGDRQVVGESGEVTGLAAGSWTVKVDAVVDGKTLSDQVAITVTEAADTDTDSGLDSETGDTNIDTAAGVLYDYTGVLNATVVYDGQYGHYEDTCQNGRLDFVVWKDHSITGSGECNVFDTDLPFAMDGLLGGGVVKGHLVMSNNGKDYPLDYSGTGNGGQTLSASFGQTWRDGGDSLSIEGGWRADPQQ